MVNINNPNKKLIRQHMALGIKKNSLPKEYSNKNTSKLEIEVDKAPYVLIVVFFIFGIFISSINLFLNYLKIEINNLSLKLLCYEFI